MVVGDAQWIHVAWYSGIDPHCCYEEWSGAVNQTWYLGLREVALLNAKKNLRKRNMFQEESYHLNKYKNESAMVEYGRTLGPEARTLCVVRINNTFFVVFRELCAYQEVVE